MQIHAPGWATPKRMRRLTVVAMCAAGIVSTVGFNGSTPAPASASIHAGAAHASR